MDSAKDQFALESGLEFRTIFENSPAATIVLGRDCKICCMNKAAQELFEAPGGGLIGRHISRIIPSLNYSELTELCQIVAKRRELENSETVEIMGVRSDGENFGLETEYQWFGEKKPDICILALNDVSQMKESLREREKLKQSLEFKVRIRTVELAEKIRERDIAQKKLRATLEELRETQSFLVEQEKMASLGNLVAGVAHEINTPVGVGLTAATHLHETAENFEKLYSTGVMKRSDLDAFVSVSLDSTKILEANLNRAAELISSFKHVAVDQSSENIRELSLNDYAEEVLSTLKPKFKNRPIDFEVDISPNLSVRINPGAFSQIITNLLINSITHAFEEDQKGTIRIIGRIEGDEVRLEYEDDGKGMDSETLSRIFDPFFTTKRGSGGSGLGMHILYNLVTQSLGGTVRCESELGNGVRFAIRFPKNMVDV